MLKTRLIHPEMLAALAAAGHGAQVLITDGNYPASTQTQPGVPRVNLNLAPGMVAATDVLEVLAETIPIEEATVMAPPEGEVPPIFAEFQALLPDAAEFNELGRFEFYDKCQENGNLCLIIVTAEQRIYANVLLTIGVVA